MQNSDGQNLDGSKTDCTRQRELQSCLKIDSLWGKAAAIEGAINLPSLFSKMMVSLCLITKGFFVSYM